MSAVLTPTGTTVVGCGVTSRDWKLRPIPLTLGEKNPTCFLVLGYVLELDPEGQHLTVSSSTYALYTDADATELLFHYDYIRDPPHGYPAAHVQISAESAPLCDLARKRGRPKKGLADFHFPVGGKRYRPTLEEVIEFMVVEELAEARGSWRTEVAGGRAEWQDIQLRSAVRRDPEVAAEQLREAGYKVTPPAPSN